MDAQLSLQIKCSVCLGDFTDPVTLPCEHSFCRQCITVHMQTSRGVAVCPECRRPFTEEDLRTSRLLRNITEAMRKHLTVQKSEANSEDVAISLRVQEVLNELMCPEHNEKLRLFCETDQVLICVICRDGEKHRGHIFKPANEAAPIKKDSVRDALDFLSRDNRELVVLTQRQSDEIDKTKEKSGLIATQISSQFEEMYQFLRKRKEEVEKLVKSEEKKALEIMQKKQCLIQRRMMAGTELEVLIQSAVDIPEPDKFLQWWSEKGYFVTEGMKQREIGENASQNIKYHSYGEGLYVIPDTLFFGPYETHLQFFVWKEMLRSIKPRR
ncbi:E3 ubiquitin-protein ligase TRIM17-like [Chanos chanos]|uniref:E3 ubiquitin-protein ligase TRIM17-like n=1 Tax=Chanos chanos TaxID=29144 RepID=A0A6J2WAT9_CHACN|nr:E3 ubiquitin-protein ligase TRIM17-like [Chanos chanos]